MGNDARRDRFKINRMEKSLVLIYKTNLTKKIFNFIAGNH